MPSVILGSDAGISGSALVTFIAAGVGLEGVSELLIPLAGDCPFAIIGAIFGKGALSVGVVVTAFSTGLLRGVGALFERISSDTVLSLENLAPRLDNIEEKVGITLALATAR
jgi:hypothetical protein